MQYYYDEELVRLVQGSGFIAGAVWSIKDPEVVITHPISSVISATLMGVTIGTGAEIVSKMLPDKAKPYFAGLLGISAGYYLVKKIYQKATNQLKNEPNTALINISLSR